MRFSLRWLLAAVAFVAIGCASLIYASSAVSNTVAAVTYGFLAFCALGAFYASRGRRPFFGGCAIVGIMYLGGGAAPGNLPTPMSVTEPVIYAIFPFAQREVEIRGPMAPTWGPSYERGGVWYTRLPHFEIFRAIGQFEVALVLSLIGGVVAKRLAGQAASLT